MIQRFILLGVLFIALLLILEDNQSSEKTAIYFISFLLIPAIIYLTYRRFLFYRSKDTKHIQTEKETENDLSFHTPHNALLNENQDFIQFLKANHTKDTINKETYRVQNLLNEVYGLIEPLLEKNHIELIYDIDINVPIELAGDSLLIEKALYTLLSTLLQNALNTTIIVQFTRKLESNEIFIHILNCNAIPPKDISCLDSTYTLLEQLNGDLEIKNDTYSIHLPVLKSPLYHESYYTLPKNVVGQQVLLIENNTLTAKTITKSLEYFGLEVTTQSTTLLPQLQNISDYDIIILDAKLLTPILIRHIEEIKMTKTLHIISIETLYGQRDRRFKPNPIVHKYLYKPLSTGMIFGTLYEIYIIQNDVKTKKQKTKTSELIFIEEIDDVTQENFQDFNHTHILVVDDNKINQKIIQSVLSKSEITITLANNGKEALEYINSESSIDIVLMDINMPIMDGYQATKKIRQDSQFESLPIIIVSSLGFRNEIEQMYLAGANAHLTKPFRIGQLYAALNMFLTKDQEIFSQEDSISDDMCDTNILDTTQGTSNTQNILAYRDTLRETLVMHKNSDEKIKEYIIKKEYTALDDYSTRVSLDAQYIGANQISQVLNEMRILLHNHEEELLQQYITLYRDTWIRTQRNIKRYLKSVDAY